MKKLLLFIYLILIITFNLHAQKDTASVSGASAKYTINDVTNVNISIYPVPVRENNFTIKSDKDISFVKVTNIIGQDIYRIKYNDPQQIVKIPLDNPRRGMYLVTIVFSDGLRAVKKILVEETN